MGETLNWAILGTGAIANEMAQTFGNMGRTISAVGNRTYEKALAFAEKYRIPKVYKNQSDMFTDPEIDIIYISTPHNTHIGFIKEALKNKKHVLCEKSITLNSRELDEAVRLAKENQVVFAEAMTIWHMPLYKKLWTMTTDHEFCSNIIPFWLGKVQMIQLNFGSYKEYDMANRFFNMDLAGGALLDIGVYAVSLARSFMTSQPENIKSQVKFAATGADEQAGILMMNEENQMAVLSLSFHARQPKRAVISCEKGYIEILEYSRADRAIIVSAETGKRFEIAEGETAKALQYEVEDMEAAVLTGKTSEMLLDITVDVMEIMTKLRKEWGMKYPGEVW